MPMSKTTTIFAASCGCCLLSVGIVCLVLGLMGYFTFEEPCFVVLSFTVTSMDLSTPEGSSSSNSIIGALDSLTGGLASQLAPTQADMTLEMILEVNNTNPYDLDYSQKTEGIVAIPADPNVTFIETNLPEEDLVIGTWEVPSSTLKKNAVNEITVTMTTSIDLTSPQAVGLTASFITGGPLAFRITGEIEGSGWVPALDGVNTFFCITRVDNILAIGEGASVRCIHSTEVGNLINTDGTIDSQQNIFEPERDPACYV